MLLLLQLLRQQKVQIDETVDLSEFWSYVEERVKEPKILEILSVLKRRKSSDE